MKQCLECSKTIKESNKFCNNSCSAKYNNRLYPKRKKKERICKNCGNIINKYTNEYCDLKCFNEYTFKNKTLPKYYLGLTSNPPTIRKILIKLNGNECSSCKCSNIWNDNPLVFHVDHIDGNSDNNNPTNLRLLCPNCHSQTSTYCGSNNNKKNTKRNNYLRKYKGYID